MFSGIRVDSIIHWAWSQLICLAVQPSRSMCCHLRLTRSSSRGWQTSMYIPSTRKASPQDAEAVALSQALRLHIASS